MAQYDVYRLAGTYLLDCQSDYLGQLETRFVIPLLPLGEVPQVHRLNPVFNIGGENLVMATQLGSPVPRRQLRSQAGSLVDEHDTIMNALDMLLTGY